jgi:hypothetical protein
MGEASFEDLGQVSERKTRAGFGRGDGLGSPQDGKHGSNIPPLRE